MYIINYKKLHKKVMTIFSGLILFPVLVLAISFFTVFSINTNEIIKSDNIIILIIAFICCVISIFLVNLLIKKIYSSINKKNEVEENKIQEENEKNRENFCATLMSIGEAVISTDIDGNIVCMNKVAEKLTGWSIKEAKNKSIELIYNVVDKKTREKAFNAVKNVLSIEKTISHEKNTILISKNDNEYIIEDNAAPIRDNSGKIFGVVLVFRDITEGYIKQKQINHISCHDNLTGLYNRLFITEEIKRLDTKRQLPISIIVADVNGLKKINDLFGYSEGDQVLIKITNILKESCRAEDIISRWGGDEFFVLLPQTTEENVHNIYKRINKSIKDSNDIKIKLNISLGYATKNTKEQKIQQVLRQAEECMYRHKLIESESMRNSIVSSLGNGLYEKSYETKNHEERMSELCRKISIELKMKDTLLVYCIIEK